MAKPFHDSERIGIPGLGVDQCPSKRSVAFQRLIDCLAILLKLAKVSPLRLLELLPKITLVDFQRLVRQDRHRIENPGDERRVSPILAEGPEVCHVRVRTFAGDLHKSVLV